MFLEIVAGLKREEVEKRKADRPLSEIEEGLKTKPRPRDFSGAVTRNPSLAVIAEIKEASPSAGVIASDPDRLWLAGQYESGGASAISVLTETNYFHGDLAHLRQVREGTALPLLLKDFVVDPYQIYEGRAAGADAILLIAALLEKEELAHFADQCRGLGMTPLVEVHGEEDLEKTAGLALPLLGVNNRDLKTLKVDLDTTFRLLKKIPQETAVISESGIRTREDVCRLREAGVKGILLGEVLMRAAEPASKIRDLLSGSARGAPGEALR